MNRTLLLPLLTLLWLFSATAVLGDDRLPYQETSDTINEAMRLHTSTYRKESYDYVDVDFCDFSYRVSGTFPAGGGRQYRILYLDMDMASLDYARCQTGHDYNPFVVLNFKKRFRAIEPGRELWVESVVINLSDDEAAKRLLAAFYNLADLCGARGPL